ncbi:fatty acid cis/trans isomerase [Thalassolituus oleivorans]|uniref:fatty acid cis/trans isomerase n=1 Tax=Thalassolituus oleivorans TaxID=187493 RepID=UPI0030C83EF6
MFYRLLDLLKKVRITQLILPVLLLAGCAAVDWKNTNIESLFGKTVITDHRALANTDNATYYTEQIEPILENRCVVCHSCYDAPCQLKLSSAEGIMRGASKTPIYNGTRLIASEPTRLGIDAENTEEWRNKGFFSVLNERSQTPEINLTNSVMYQMLVLKKNQPLPADTLLDDDFKLHLNSERQCPTREEFNEFADDHPLWGMPYALPGLKDEEYSLLTDWIKRGAPMASPIELPRAVEQRVSHWEAYLNSDDLKQQLASRYMYEHLFLASLYFSEEPLFNGSEPQQQPEYFFKLVRSYSAPGLPIRPVATRRPYDDPGAKRIYYRLKRDTSTVVAKTLMPYRLNEERMDWMKSLFNTPDYTVDVLPDYDPKTAANPFIAFQALPINSRYRFMLEESEYIIKGFIKGPVCRGQVALNVIDDHFWAFFVDPDDYDEEQYGKFLAEQSNNLRLPGEAESNTGILANWLRYSNLHSKYLDAKNSMLLDRFPEGKHLNLDLVWDGDGNNPNAALTITRHFDSATVVKGLVGQYPKTAWIVGYPLLERIHYLLVAEFDVFGNVGHQLMTRLYMDFLRMEGEANFLTMLPQNERIKLTNYWYRDASKDVKKHLVDNEAHVLSDPDIRYYSDQPKLELLEMLRNKLEPVLSHQYDLATKVAPEILAALEKINRIQGRAATLMPEISMIMIDDYSGSQKVYTLLRNSAHSNLTGLLYEDENRLPEEDYLTLVPGVMGSHPAAFYRLSSFRLNDFVDAISKLDDESDYYRFATRFAVRRTDSAFWTHSDQMLAWYKKNDPLNAGLLDYNRLENR